MMTEWEAAKLSDVMSIAEAACCIVGVTPTCLGSNTSTEPYLADDGFSFPSGNPAQMVFSRVVASMVNSISVGKLAAAKLVRTESEKIDAWATLIDVDALKDWLLSRNCRPEFFFPEALPEVPNYLNPAHPRYSGKLAAAVCAWEAVTDPGKISPKQALEKWLNEHAARFDMTNDDGMPVKQAVADCAKVANWKPDGGAPKTPG